MDAISSNLANMSSLQRDENGEMQPYEGKYAVFQTDDQVSTQNGAIGVKVASIETEKIEPNYRWEPEHPYAIKDRPEEGLRRLSPDQHDGRDGRCPGRRAGLRSQPRCDGNQQEHGPAIVPDFG